jgi:hypothetical protein
VRLASAAARLRPAARARDPGTALARRAGIGYRFGRSEPRGLDPRRSAAGASSRTQSAGSAGPGARRPVAGQAEGAAQGALHHPTRAPSGPEAARSGRPARRITRPARDPHRRGEDEPRGRAGDSREPRGPRAKQASTAS